MRTRDFEELAARLARRRRGDDEWQPGTPFSVLPARRATREVLFSTKESGLMGLHVTDLLRSSTTWIWHYGLTSRPEWLRLRAERELGATVVHFLGDLGPLDLAVFPGAMPAGVGAEAQAILGAGQKLQIEGASNPVFYEGGFSAALEKMLRRRLAAMRR